MVNETEQMFFPPERFSGELIIGEYRVPVEFSAMTSPHFIVQLRDLTYATKPIEDRLQGVYSSAW